MENRHHTTNSVTLTGQPDWPQAQPPVDAAEPRIEGSHHLASYVPSEIEHIGRDHQTALPRIAKDPHLTRLIDQALRQVPTRHEIYPGDARRMNFLQPESVHLVTCSPPYWTLKDYRETEGQLGHVSDYEDFLAELDRVWSHCYRALAPGGRLIIVVGDVCLSRRRNKGRHTVVPLHASIQEHCRKLGFDNLQGIFWHKIANAAYEVENGSGFLGKPYEPNAVIKNDVEYILMQRKPGGYRSPSVATRVMSVISEQNYQKWFRLVWDDLPGASTRDHPAPYPIELAERLIRMFSFAGDTVLDPFLGTGSTSIAAARCGRNSIGVEIDPHYRKMASDRLASETSGLFSQVTLQVHGE
ncbi:MAG TPA: site-specific DNA-methyltransferase [Terriglobia bacterium]|nr:site-specific DNA-methyltransferase [Terriglobia bacterium]